MLDRLGLKSEGNNQQHHELQTVVSNFVENCIGSVEREKNTVEYDRKYEELFQSMCKDKGRDKESSSSAIFVSPLTQLEHINRLPEVGLWRIYRQGRLLLKYISLSCEKVVLHPLF